MRYRWLLVVLATQVVALPLLLAAGPSLQTKGLRTLRLNIFPPGDAATVAARARGFFAAEGLDVEIIPTVSSTAQMRGLSEGAWELAGTAFDNVLAWSGREGAEIVSVAQYESGNYLPVYARPEIRDWEDLRGKPLAVDAIDTAFALVLRRILLAHDLDLERGDYELVAVGGTGQRLQSLLRGETFAGVLSEPFDIQAEEAGLRKLGDQREVLPDYPGSTISVTRAWAQANRDVLVRFLRARLAGARWVEANREAMLDLWAADQGASPESLVGRLELMSPDGALNLAGLASVLDLRTRFGYTLPIGTDLSRYYDLSYLQAARGQ